MPDPIEIARRLGALRLLMAALVVALVAVAPFSGGPSASSGWPLALNVIAPTIFAMMIFVLPLDITMSLVFRAAKEGAERRRFGTVIAVDAALLAALVLAWLPLLVRLLG